MQVGDYAILNNNVPSYQRVGLDYSNVFNQYNSYFTFPHQITTVTARDGTKVRLDGLVNHYFDRASVILTDASGVPLTEEREEETIEVGDTIRFTSNIFLDENRLSLTTSYLRVLAGSNYEREYLVQAINVSGNVILEGISMYTFCSRGVQIVRKKLADPVFRVGSKVRIVNNPIRLQEDSIFEGVYTELLRDISNDFNHIWTITENRGVTNAVYGDWFKLDTPGRLIFRKGNLELVSNNLQVGDIVKINRDVLSEGVRISVESNFGLKAFIRNFTVTEIQHSAEKWISLANNTRMLFLETELILQPSTAQNLKKIPTLKPIKEKKLETLPTLEEIVAMSANDVYDKYYANFKKIIETKLYSAAKYTIGQGKDKKEFKNKLEEYFFGTSSCNIESGEDAKKIVVNWLTLGADLQKELADLQKVEQLRCDFFAVLRDSYIEETKQRATIILNRGKTQLFDQPSEENCKNFFEKTQEYINNLAELKQLFKTAKENIQKIEEIAKIILLNQKELGGLKARLDISYKNDTKKLGLAQYRVTLRKILTEIPIKDSNIKEKNNRVELLENLSINWDKGNVLSIYKTCKEFILRNKEKI